MHVPALTDHTSITKAAYAQGSINDHKVEMLLDSGASCSVVRQDYVSPTDLEPLGSVQLVNADGKGLTSVGLTTMPATMAVGQFLYRFYQMGHPIAYASSTFQPAQWNYAQVDEDALSFVYTMQNFHKYIYGQPFTLVPDHKLLTTIFEPERGPQYWQLQ